MSCATDLVDRNATGSGLPHAKRVSSSAGTPADAITCQPSGQSPARDDLIILYHNALRLRMLRRCYGAKKLPYRHMPVAATHDFGHDLSPVRLIVNIFQAPVAIKIRRMGWVRFDPSTTLRAGRRSSFHPMTEDLPKIVCDVSTGWYFASRAKHLLIARSPNPCCSKLIPNRALESGASAIHYPDPQQLKSF